MASAPFVVGETYPVTVLAKHTGKLRARSQGLKGRFESSNCARTVSLGARAEQDLLWQLPQQLQARAFASRLVGARAVKWAESPTSSVEQWHARMSHARAVATLCIAGLAA